MMRPTGAEFDSPCKTGAGQIINGPKKDEQPGLEWAAAGAKV